MDEEVSHVVADSPTKVRTVETAAYAVLFIALHRHWDEFQTFIQKDCEPPTADQIAKMRSMGIDPDAE